MITKLVIENLKHRPVRTLLSICAIGLEVTMMLTIVGLSKGTIAESERRARGIGADIYVRPPGSSVLSMGSASMEQKFLPFFEKQPHVTLATGSVAHPIGGIDTVTGIDLDKFSRMSGGFRYIAGGPFKNPDDILIDERYASQKNLTVGSKIKILNRDWTVSGIVEPGKLARLFLPLDRLQELTANTGKLSQAFIKVDNEENVPSVIASLKQQLEGYQIYSVQDLTALFSIDNAPGLREFIGVVVGLSVIVGFLVVFLSMYTAVLERTREIGILKALGASPGYVLGILLWETAFLAVAGSLLGIVSTYGTRWLVATYTGPSLVQMIVYDWWPVAAGIALVGALLGSLYPGWKAVRQDALEALSYE